MKPPGMLLSSETYHIRISSITQDDICACTLLADYQKSTYQQTKLLSSTSIDNYTTAISLFSVLRTQFPTNYAYAIHC
jgi:hypothetical protein